VDESLVKKLRVPATGRVAVVQPPEGFLERIGQEDTAAGLDLGSAASYDYVQLFARHSTDVAELVPDALRAIKPGGLLWMCYPKGSSKLKTDINRDFGWSSMSEAGWEGVALVSVDDTWSAMRFRPREAVGRSRPTPAERKAAAAEKQPAGETEVPAELMTALDAVPEAAAFFDKLALSHKKEYVLWVAEAKREETRNSRISKVIEKLGKGLKRPTDKA
jgi:hypothetical protein